MITFPVTPIWNLGFLSDLPPGFQLKKNKGRRSSGRSHTRFLSRHVQRETVWLGIAGHPLAKDSLSWINCKRRQRGSTGSAFCGGFGPEWGRAAQWLGVQWKAAATYWPRATLSTEARSRKPVSTPPASPRFVETHHCFCFSTSRASKTSPVASSPLVLLFPRWFHSTPILSIRTILTSAQIPIWKLELNNV